ncbi:MAG: FAD-dependent oxidoreductase [Candidatus Omnitrophota bacterium]
MKIAIIGNGICGVSAAKSITEISQKEEISIFADEKYHYYPRPLLDNLLLGKIGLDQIAVYKEEWYNRRNIKVFLEDRVTAFELSSKRLRAERTGWHDYDKLLIAGGSASFIPAINGIDSEAVFTYRNIADVLKVREYVRSKKKAVVLGGGLLGLEVARTLAKLGLSVTVIERASRLLPRQLDSEGAAILKSGIEKQYKIEVMLETTCESILSEGPSKCALSRKAGKIEADLFVISSGIRPNIELANNSGLKVNNGILVDKNLRAGYDYVFAAGDCAEFNGVVYGIIPAAIEQAQAAASNIMGKALDYKGTIFQTTLKVVGFDLTSIGLINPEVEGYEQVVKKDLDKGAYKKCVIRDGKLVGAIILGQKDGVSELAEIIKSGVLVSTNKGALTESGDVLREIFLQKA